MSPSAIAARLEQRAAALQGEAEQLRILADRIRAREQRAQLARDPLAMLRAFEQLRGTGASRSSAVCALADRFNLTARRIQQILRAGREAEQQPVHILAANPPAGS